MVDMENVMSAEGDTMHAYSCPWRGKSQQARAYGSKADWPAYLGCGHDFVRLDRGAVPLTAMLDMSTWYRIGCYLIAKGAELSTAFLQQRHLDDDNNNHLLGDTHTPFW